VPGGERVLFVHVMKTGGMTLYESVRDQLTRAEVYPDPELDLSAESSGGGPFRPFTIPYLLTLGEERRRRIRFYVGHFPYVASEMLDDDLATITILRDPVERTISLLRQLRRKAPFMDSSRYPSMSSQSMEEVYEQANVFEGLVHNHQTKIFSMTRGDEPRGYMQVIDVDRNRLALAQENLARVDVVGLTERYDEFIDDVTDRFGWVIDHSAKVNVTPTSADEPEVSEAFRRRIAEENTIDIEFYEYAKSLVETRRGTRVHG
jgi:hypothetical protein